MACDSALARLLGLGQAPWRGVSRELLAPLARADAESLCAAVRAAAEGGRGGFECDAIVRRGEADEQLVMLRGAGIRPGLVAGIAVEMSSRRQSVAALERTAAALRQSNEALEQFAYVASHDLQEPLRMVASYVQLLDRRYGDKLDESAREFITFAVDGAKRMQRMIADLLAYSRVIRGPAPTGWVDMNAVADEAALNLEGSIIRHVARVTRDHLPMVFGDAPQLQQLLLNLLGNAIKFQGDDPPKVHLSASRGHEEWIFCVRDNGIGIAPEHATKIFAVFQRLHGTGEYEGTGIGLAICRRIVERHGGRIWMEPAADQGSCFHFSLPDPVQDRTHELHHDDKHPPRAEADPAD